MHGTSATGERGFTLIELLVVLTILVLIAGLFPLTLNRALSARRTEAAARTMWSALRFAQSLSTASGREVRVTISDRRIELDTVDRSWKLQADAASAGVITGNASPLHILFYPDGTSSGAEVELVSGKHKRGLLVSALTGRISLGRQ